jgi:hypothetical protein
VPTKDDFVALDLALGGNGQNRDASLSWITAQYVNAWGGVYAGHAYGSVMESVGALASYWASTESGSKAYFLAFSKGGLVFPQFNNDRFYGFQVRCVKEI